MAGEVDAAVPTELAGVAEMGTEAVHAWSLDEADADYPLTGSWEDPERRWTPQRITIAAVVVSALLVGGAVGVAAWKLRQDDAVHTEVVVATTPTIGIVEPPKPPPVTVTQTVKAQPTPETVRPTASPHLQLSPVDIGFIEALRRDGFTGTSDDLIAGAVSVCRDLQHGIDLPEISQKMAAHNDLTPDQAHWFASEVVLAYSCHLR